MTQYQHPSGFAPLRSLIDNVPGWVKKLVNPEGQSAGGQFEPLDQIGLTHFNVQSTDKVFKVSGQAQVQGQLKLLFPQLDGASLEFLPSKEGGSFFALDFSLSTKPDFRLTLKKPKIQLNLPKGFLKPVKKEKRSKDNKIIYKIDPKKEQVSFTLTPGDITIDEKGNLQLGEEKGKTSVEAGACDMALGDTGIYLVNFTMGIESTGSDTAFKIPNATVILPEDLVGDMPSMNLTCQECTIDKNGFSGTISTLWDTPVKVTLLGFTAFLSQFSVRFSGNRLTHVMISGQMGIPFFDDPNKPKSPVNITVGLGNDGKIVAGLSPAIKTSGDTYPALAELDLEFMALKLSKVSISIDTESEEGNKGMVNLSGWFILDKKGKQPLALEFRDLKVWSDGSVSFPGGWFDVKDKLTYSKGGFKIGISRFGIGLGQGEKKENFIGFSGGLQLVGNLPAGAAVEGMRFIWDQKGNHRFMISGVNLNFEVPKTIKLKGGLEFFEPDNPPNLPGFEDLKITGLRGKAFLEIVPMELAVNGDFLVVRDHKGRKYWFIRIGMKLPVGIPLGPTGLAIYGFSGLVAENLEPNKKPGEHWYRDWYRRSPVGVDHSEKWGPLDNKGAALALGIGTTLGTAFDKGKTFNCRALLVVSLPGPTLMLTGKANIFTDISRLAEPSAEGQFQFLLVFDGKEKSLLFNIEINYIQKKLLEVRGILELYFHFRDPELWHLYLGEKPKPRRIKAKLLNFLEANAYLMVDSRKFLFGFFIGYNPKPWTFGPLTVKLAAYMQSEVGIGWEPQYFNADMKIYGEIFVQLFWIKLGLVLYAQLKGTTPKPFLVDIEAGVKLNLPFPLPSPEIKLHLVWKAIRPPDFHNPLQSVQLDQNEALENTFSWEAIEKNDFSPNYKSVPMDARISLVFERQVGMDSDLKSKLSKRSKNGKRIPLPIQSSEFTVGREGLDFIFDYEITQLTLKRWVKGKWFPETTWFEEGLDFSWAVQKVKNTKSPETESGRPEAVVLQMGTHDPNRMNRTRTSQHWSDRETGKLKEFMCPTHVSIYTICWEPPEVSSPQLWAGTYPQEDFILQIEGLCYRGDKDLCGAYTQLKWIGEEDETPGFETPIGLGVLSLAVAGKTKAVLLSLNRGTITILFNETMSFVDFSLKYRGSIHYHIQDLEGNTLDEGTENSGTSHWTHLNYPKNKNLISRSPSKIIKLTISGSCFCLNSLCYTKYQTWKQAMFVKDSYIYWDWVVESWAYTGLILEPDSTYRLEAEVTGNRKKKGENTTDKKIFNHSYFFKTSGPPDDLEPYIERTTPLDGEALFFRDYYIDIIFKPQCDYVPQMFQKAKARLELLLQGPDKNPETYHVMEVEGNILQLTRSQEMIGKVSTCIGEKMKEVERTFKSKQWQFGSGKSRWILKPQAKYQASLKSSSSKDPLYQFSFVTSRFRNFKEFVSTGITNWTYDLDNPRELSGQLLDKKKAGEFNVTLDNKKKWETFLRDFSTKTPTGNDRILSKRDRKSEGKRFEELASALKFPSYLRPRYLEVHQVYNKQTHFGYLFEFPEPIDWRRTTLEAELLRLEPQIDSKFVIISGINLGTVYEYAFLRSEDSTRAFLSFKPMKKIVIQRNPFEAWMNRTNPVEMEGSITYKGEYENRPELSDSFLEKEENSSGLTLLFKALMSWVTMTVNFLSYSLQKVLKIPTTQRTEKILKDQELSLKLKVKFEYTLDFIEKSGFKKEPDKVNEFIGKYPDLVRLRGNKLTDSEKAILELEFDNTYSKGKES
jgi:hypothetical protein